MHVCVFVLVLVFVYVCVCVCVVNVSYKVERRIWEQAYEGQVRLVGFVSSSSDEGDNKNNNDNNNSMTKTTTNRQLGREGEEEEEENDDDDSGGGDSHLPAPSFGRLELQRGSIWGTVCSMGFRASAANSACRQLGYTHATAYGRSEE